MVIVMKTFSITITSCFMHQSLFHLMKAITSYTQMLLESGAHSLHLKYKEDNFPTNKDSKPNIQMMTLIVNKYTS